MTTEILTGDLLTGRILTRNIPVTGCSWRVMHRDAGDVSATIPLRSQQAQRIPGLLQHLDPVRCFIAAVVDGTIMEAGPIWSHAYNNESGTLQVKGVGLWSYWDHRKLVAPIGPGVRVQDTVVDLHDLSLGTIAKRLAQLAMDHPGGHLPIVLPEDEAGPDSRSYPGYEVAWLGERLQQLQQVIDGPDIAFEPRFTADGLGVEWVMQTGSIAEPMLHQDGPDHVWDACAHSTTVTGLDVAVDATEIGARAWSVGSGSGMDVELSTRADPYLLDAGYPLTEVAESLTSMTGQPLLDANAEALIARSRRPWQTWSLTVQSDQTPTVGTYRPGDWARIWLPADHEYLNLERGYFRTRILAVAGDLSDRVKLTLAPMMEAR